MIDYLIVGQGLAGSILSYRLLKQGKKVKVIDPHLEKTSSKVAAGIYNPITGKRIVKSWMVDQLYPELKKLYKELELVLNTSFDHKTEIVRFFTTQDQQTDLLAKADDERYASYVKVNLDEEKYQKTIAFEYSGFNIEGGGVMDTALFVSKYRDYLKKEKLLIEGYFNYDSIEEYGAKKIIFCEGYKSIENPFFNWLPFSPTKGEMLIIKSDLNIDHIINKQLFIVPKGDNHYLVGATFELKFNEDVTAKGKNQLTEKLDKIIKTPYTIVKHIAGVRPTVRDRRPFLGVHPDRENMFIFNGFGTKGVSLIPYWSSEMVDFLENGRELDREVNIERFYSLYSNLSKKN